MDEELKKTELKRLRGEIESAAVRLGMPRGKKFVPETAPAVLLTDALFYEASLLGASDIHITPEEDGVRVRYRIDGDLYDRVTFPKAGLLSVVTRMKAISGMDIAEHRLPQNGRFSRDLYGKDYDLRVSAVPSAYGENIVIRLLSRELPFTFRELAFTPDEEAAVLRMLSKPGLVLLTGPTGCGKSTTLACFLKELVSEHRNIVTVEDPVEYLIEGAEQISLPADGRLTLGMALKDVLRQDPDIVMIGEIRDAETAREAVRMAIAGRLVLSTLHTADAVHAVPRLRDLGVENGFLADALTGVIAQRLVKRICPHCRTQYTAENIEIPDVRQLFRGNGCEECQGRGVKGRIAVHEVMEVTPRLRSAIREGKETDELFSIAKEVGMQTMGENALELLKRGVIDLNAFRSVTGLPERK